MDITTPDPTHCDSRIALFAWSEERNVHVSLLLTFPHQQIAKLHDLKWMESYKLRIVMSYHLIFSLQTNIDWATPPR